MKIKRRKVRTKSFGLRMFGFGVFIRFSSHAVFCKKSGFWDFSMHFKYRHIEYYNNLKKRNEQNQELQV